MRNKIIGSFPLPSPGELFYSVCARHNHLIGLSDRDLCIELCGGRDRKISLQFPKYLNYFAEKVAWIPYYSAERIIYEHSLYPVYAPFMPIAVRNRFKESLLGNKTARTPSLMGSLSLFVQDLRFCPLCAKDEKEHNDYTYWHQLHHINDVLVCPKHKIFLEPASGAALYPWSEGGSTLYVADDYTPEMIPRNNSGPISRYLERIAEDFQWLIDNPYKEWNTEHIVHAYRTLLDEKGILKIGATTSKIRDLADEIRSFYPEELLMTFKQQLPDAGWSWVVLLLENAKYNVRTPIRHLLLLHFIGIGIGEFHDYISAQINSKMTNFRPNSEEKAIQGKHRRTRPKPDYEVDDFKSWWSDSTISLSEIERRSGINRHKLYRFAEKMGLRIPRFEKDDDMWSKTTMKYRKRWLAMRKTEPYLSRADIIKHYPQLHNHIILYDHKWYIEHVPPKNKAYYVKKQHDAHRLDLEIASLIPAIVDELERTQEPRPRITQQLIMKKIRVLKSYNLNVIYPETKKTLRIYSESQEDYDVKRIFWAINTLSNKHLSITKSKLFWNLSLRRAQNNKKVMHALDEGIAELERREKAYPGGFCPYIGKAPLIRLRSRVRFRISF